jgi:hypothetical protein
MLSEGYIEVGGKCGNYFTRNMVYPLSGRQQAFTDLKKKTGGRDMYYCTYVFDNKERKEGTRYFSPLYFDIDGDIQTDDGFERVRLATLSLATILNLELRLKVNEMKFYFSGGKGFHVFIDPRVLGVKPTSKLPMLYKSFISYISTKIENSALLDTRIYDNRRLIRFPNTVNDKTGLYKIPVTYNQLRTLTRAQILELAKTPQQEYVTSAALNPEASSRFVDKLREIIQSVPQKTTGNIHIPSSVQKLPLCVKYLLTTAVNKGGRNNTLALIASLLVQNGYVGDVAIGILQKWNLNNEEPLTDHELITTYNSAERMAKAGRGYGCSSIRQQGVFAPREVCPKCKIFISKQKQGA